MPHHSLKIKNEGVFESSTVDWVDLRTKRFEEIELGFLNDVRNKNTKFT